ncbi:MAG: helix-hairpin-helix domain-containing protein [Bacteroidota bacterium]
MQQQIDSLKRLAQVKDTAKIYPFNPNFITDYKGYMLGMSVAEIDRLHDYRKTDRYVDSAKEFQEVTQVSDSLLNTISPYFRFPEWSQHKRKPYVKYTPRTNMAISGSTIRDLNSASIDELTSVYGIGEKLATRIVKFRDRLGGFLVNDQLYDVYGLRPEVVERALLQFQVLHKPDIKKININSATSSEIAELVYIRYDVANKIVRYRNEKGGIATFGELRAIEGFPSEKIDRIKLYLLL